MIAWLLAAALLALAAQALAHGAPPIVVIVSALGSLGVVYQQLAAHRD